VSGVGRGKQLRRLLVFGTGAAVIGTLLLIFAFYETYHIVNTLQSYLTGAAGGASSNLLEDSTLEAVFLGIMAGLGYLLIAQGLEGIRKQELVDMQRGTAKLAAGGQRLRSPYAEGQGERPSGWRSVLSPQGGVAQMSGGSGEQQPPPSGSEAQRAYSSSSQPQTPSSSGSEAGKGKMVAEEPLRSQPGQTPSTTPPAVEKGTEPTSVTLSPEASGSGGVAWEGGPPTPLEGVEVVPEPPVYRDWPAASLRAVHAAHAAEPTEPAPSEGVQEGTTPAPRKRGRGRPKGTKKKAEKAEKPEQTEVPEQNGQPEHIENSEQNGQPEQVETTEQVEKPEQTGQPGQNA